MKYLDLNTSKNIGSWQLITYSSPRGFLATILSHIQRGLVRALIYREEASSSMHDHASFAVAATWPLKYLMKA